MGYLALAYMKLGRWADAIKLGERLLESDTKLLGREHPDTRFVMQNLAIAYSNLGQTRNASNVSATSTTIDLIDLLLLAISLVDNQRPHQTHNQRSQPAAPTYRTAVRQQGQPVASQQGAEDTERTAQQGATERRTTQDKPWDEWE